MMATEAPGARVSYTMCRFCSTERNWRRRAPERRSSARTLCTLPASNLTLHGYATECPLTSRAHHVSVCCSGGDGTHNTVTLITPWREITGTPTRRAISSLYEVIRCGFCNQHFAFTCLWFRRSSTRCGVWDENMNKKHSAYFNVALYLRT